MGEIFDHGVHGLLANSGKKLCVNNVWLLEKQPFESFAKFSVNFQDVTSFGKMLKKFNSNFGKILRKEKIRWKF